jgi:hypothetical protein
MHDYIELLTSLPYIADPFKHSRPPISLIQLRKRFSMLSENDRVLMEELWHSFWWRNISLTIQDAQVCQLFSSLLDKVTDKDICAWLRWRMDFRLLTAALRFRMSGLDAFPVSEWDSDVAKTITLHWSQIDFGLGQRYPWLQQANQLLLAKESFALERLLFNRLWQFYSRCEPKSTTGFAAVFLYTLRWDICYRWTSYEGLKGRERFDQLVDSSFTQFSELRSTQYEWQRI